MRNQWVSASHFHDLTQAQVLAEVARRVREVKAAAGSDQKRHPLVLLDLDSTLYEVAPRTLQLLKEWAASAEAAVHAQVRDALSRLTNAQVGYSVRDTFLALGLDPASAEIASAFEGAKGAWGRGFFSDAYLKYDHPYPGAAAFTRELHDLGAEIVYLTGRDGPNMGVGTRECLLRDGFPWEKDRTHLLMKRAFEESDLDHKKEAAHYIRQHGTLIASFENEPKNLVALHALFPEAMHVFVDTICSDHEAPPARGLYRIAGFDRV
jgi:hypothetical protein